MTAWRIDSLDARGGLAFASWRHADLITESLDLSRAAVFLSPPTFEPEAVQNRTIAMTATRGQAQLGVFLDDEELAFPTLETLSEFVRRVYTSGGAGDLPGGGAPGGRPTPPLMPEDEREIPRAPGREGDREDGSYAFLAAANQAALHSSQLPFDAGAPVRWIAFDGKQEARQAGPMGPTRSSLALGAAELVLEMLRRFPGPGHTGFALWADAAHRLGHAVSRLSLWPGVIDGPFGTVFDSAMRVVAGSLARPHPFPNDRHLTSALFGAWGGSGWRAQHWLDELEYYVKRDSLQISSDGGGERGGDPIDDLASWPLPREVADLIGRTADRSAVSLMSAVCGAPAILAGRVEASAQAASILMFCAAHVVGQGAAPPQRGWLLPEAYDAGLDLLGEAAREWLFAQWPATLYPTRVEDLIGAAAGLDPRLVAA